MVARFIKAARKSDKKHVSRVRAVRPSRRIEAWYRSELLSIVSVYRAAVSSRVLPVVEKVLAGDALVSRLSAALGKLDASFPGARADKLAAKLLSRSDAQVTEMLTAMVGRSFNVDLAGFLKGSPKLRTVIAAATVTNVGLIRSIPAEYSQRVRSSVLTAVTQGLRFEAVRDDLMDIGGITERRAKFIARDQVAKLNSSINRVRQQDLGITQYVWSTSGDERVRQTHQDNDGKTFSWDNPPSDTGNPGDDYQCRCVAIPIIDLDDE